LGFGKTEIFLRRGLDSQMPVSPRDLPVGQSLQHPLERFQAKWKPVRVKKTRQIKNLEPRFDSIEAEKALAAKSALAAQWCAIATPRTTVADHSKIV
jgi:hypothetical protein